MQEADVEGQKACTAMLLASDHFATAAKPTRLNNDAFVYHADARLAHFLPY
jgi:hypothetical protein